MKTDRPNGRRKSLSPKWWSGRPGASTPGVPEGFRDAWPNGDTVAIGRERGNRGEVPPFLWLASLTPTTDPAAPSWAASFFGLAGSVPDRDHARKRDA